MQLKDEVTKVLLPTGVGTGVSLWEVVTAIPLEKWVAICTIVYLVVSTVIAVAKWVKGK